MIFAQLSLEAPLSVIGSPFLLSLRAERGNLSEVPDCFVVRQLTDFLAMTEGGHWEPFTSCHSERSEESQEAQDRLRVAISGNSNGKNAK